MHRTISFPFTVPRLPKLAGYLRSAVCASAIALLFLFAASAGAQTTWTVNTTADSNDGSCSSTTCSLRDAIAAANADSGDTINFTINGTITLTSALPAIARSMTIQGPAASALTVSGNNANRVFSINPGVTVTISGLTVANGRTSDFGAGISNQGTLTLSNSAFSGNSVPGNGSGGGAVGNQGTLTVINSTFSGNSAPGYGSGGAINNQGTLTVSNSTFSGNSAGQGGGGIFNQGATFTQRGTLTITNSTFSGNSAGGSQGGGIFNLFGALAVSNSIFTGNSAGGGQGGGIFNLNGATSESNNLFFNNSGGDSNNLNLSSTDVSGKDPLLAPLGNYGGPTQTMLPLPGSPAICAGTASPANATLPAADQRGFPMNTSCVDIGSMQTNYKIVNTTADSGTGSLRDAMTQANTAGFGDIAFSVNGTITLANPSPQITAQVNIVGPGANNLTLSGTNQFHGFYVASGANAVISGLTIANAWSGIDNFGTLTVSNCAFSGNFFGTGGGISNNQGTVTVSNSTFSGNYTDAYGGGGGIYNNTRSTLTVSNSTFSGNSSFQGGGIYIAYGSTGAVSNSTFSGNSANGYGGGGGIYSDGTLTVSNSIFSGNSASQGAGGIADAGGLIPSESNNLFFNNSGGDSSRFTLSSSDLTGQDPMLAPLGSYGGPTQTMLPLPGSAAICAGAPSAAPAGITTDQRGFPRTTTYNVSGNSTTCLDIGAVETNYQSIQFTNATNGYSANVNQDVSPAPNVTVTENGQSRDGVPVTLSISGSPTASGLTAITANGNGATFSSLIVGAPGNYTLSATLNLNPATATPALSITTNPTAVLTVNQIAVSVSISNIPASATYGGSFTPTYTVTPTGDTGTTSVNSLTTGTCTVTGGTVNFVGAGTCTLQASVAATSNYPAVTGSPQSFTIGQASAMVSISNIPASATYGGSFTPAYTVTPTGDTGTTSVNSLTTGTCTVTGGTVNFVGVGTCTLQAAVAATTNYSAATGSPQSFTIGQASATVSISNVPASATYGGSFTPTYTVSPSGDTGARSVASLTTGTCTVTCGTVNFVGVGTCTLQASIAATTNYSAATGSPQSFTIGQASATVSISNVPASAAYGGGFTPMYTVSPSGDTGARSVASLTTGTCTVTGGTVNFVGVGTCTLQGAVAATTNYSAGTGSPQSFTIGQASATVSISNMPLAATIGGSFTPTYTVSPSGDTGARSVASLTTGTCTVTGGTVNFVGVGTCTLQASVAATTDYAAGTGSPQTLKITYGIVVLYNQTSANSGSTIPVKVQLTNYSGGNLSSSNITVTATGISPSPAPGNAPGGNFTFMSMSDAGPMYQLNVKTTGYPSGTYTLSFTVSGDPVSHTVGFVVQ